MRHFISGHLDITDAEFNEHYVPRLKAAAEAGDSFVVGDCRGADYMAQQWLKDNHPDVNVIVFHMFRLPRNNAGWPCVSGFQSGAGRDGAMTVASDADIAWIRPGREKSGTAKNLAKRRKHA